MHTNKFKRIFKGLKFVKKNTFSCHGFSDLKSLIGTISMFMFLMH